MKIQIPEGFEVPPEGRGKDFTITAEVHDNGDGTLTLISIDGTEIEDADEQETEGPNAEEEEMQEQESGGMPEETFFERMKKAGIGKRVGG